MPRISLDGDSIDAEPGDTVAAALLRNGVTTFTRSIKYHRPRGPFCLTGTCGQCLMRIDGAPSLLACRVRAEEGMQCERQNAALGFAEADLLRAADFVFADGLDHHHLLTGSRLLGRVALEVARRLAGLGHLPSEARRAAPGALRRVKLAIVGAGSAGLAAARAAGAGALLVERESKAGGSRLLFGEPVDASPGQAELLAGAECVGLYTNDTPHPGNALLVVRRQGSLLAVLAERVIVANGGAPQPWPFPGVDRPGVYAARGLLGLPLRVGTRLAVAGEGEERDACAAALSRKGYEIALESIPRRALGNPVRAIDTQDGRRVRCDAVALATPPAPLHGLGSSVGAKAKWVPELGGFALETDAEGRTAVPWLFAAGRVAGKPARESGEAAGRAAWR